jgi:acetolactate synthase I/II/III large subunit
MPTACEYLAHSVERLGVRHVFGVGGANIEDFYDAVHRTARVRGVLAKHEFSAATMADGYARVGAPLGVVVATSGGGALNLVPALAEAHASNVPVLALVGQPPTALEGRGAFQDGSGRAGAIDLQALFATVSRYCHRVTHANELPRAVYEAVAAACGERSGPAVLLLPKDVQCATVESRAPAFGLLPAAIRRPPSLSRVEEAAELLLRARTVLVIAGDGVARYDARDELSALVRRIGAAVAVMPDARDVFDNRDPSFAGVLGVMGHASVASWLTRADVCVAVGTRIPQLGRVGIEAELAGRPLVSLHVEPSFVKGSPHLELNGDIKAGLRALYVRLAPRMAPAATPDTPEEHVATFLPGARRGTLGFRDAIEAVAATLPEDANVFVDAGNTGASAIHWLKSPPLGRFVVALGMGGMGYSFGAAIGAAFANGRRTYVLAGDGAFYTHGLEIHTALEYRLPVTFIVFDNGAHGMCFTREHLYYGGDYSYNLFQPSELGAGLAAMFPTLTVLPGRTPSEIGESLRNAPAGPTMMSIAVDACEVPPFVPFQQAMTRLDENRPRKAG